ncbi:MAG: hypothetical protein PHP42_06260 [Bacteroidota bacterium]|nr:hypothetical protein [Bacteroidota bacterium]
MDYILTFWQEYISLGIVAAAFVLLVRYEINAKENKKDCGNCTLAAMKDQIRYTQRHQ